MIKPIFIVFLLITTSCSSYKIKNFESYKPVKATTFDQSSVLKAKKNIIAIVQFDEVGEFSKTNEIGKSLSNLIEAEIVSNKYGSVEDRSLLLKLKDEIAIHEMNSSSNGLKTPVEANYAISGKINASGYAQSSKINWISVLARIANEGKGSDPLNKTVGTTNLDATVDVLELPSLVKLKTIRCSVDYTKVVPNGSDLKSDGTGIVKSSGKCIDKIMPEILKILQPRAQITEKRIFEDNAIFKIEIGADFGVKTGQKIEIKRLYDDGKEKNTGVKTAYVSNEIEPDSAWIIVKDEDEARRIKLGDFAYLSIKYEKKVSAIEEMMD